MPDNELPDEGALPKVPASTAGWLLLLWERMEHQISSEFATLRLDLANKADKVDLIRIDSEFGGLRGRVEQLEEDKKSRKAVHKFSLTVWKAIAAACAVAASVSLIVYNFHIVH